MHTRIGLSYFAAIILAGTLVACGPSAAAKRRADSAVAAAAKAHVVSQAGEVLSARREAQVFVDGARVSFIGKHRAAAAKSLREAASFTRQQSETAAGLDKEALTKSAKELERVATGVSNGAVKSVRTLDLAIARMQMGEAQFHYSRVMAAWNKSDAGVAGAELTMAIDHFDRGVGSAGLRLDAETQAAANDIHTLASEMISGAILTAADVEKTLTTFDNELQHVATVVSKKK
jgi:hypothetical protein